MFGRLCIALLGAVPVLAGDAAAEVSPGDYYADIYVDGDKAGVAHFSSRREKGGRVEEIRSDISISFLGFEVFEFEQHVVEEWEDGELQFLSGRTNDNGDLHEFSLRRREDGYRGRLSEERVTLPADAYPTSPWHYDIVEQDLLFALKDLELRKVEVSGPTEETVTVDGVDVETERFEITGDWSATIWYDRERRLVRVRHTSRGHEIVVLPERSRAPDAPTD